VMAMPNSVQIGLAVTSHSYGILNTTTFDQVRVSTSSIPEPPVLRAHLSGHTLSLSVPTATGRSYLLEYKNSLSDSTWSVLGTQPGNGGSASFTDDATANPARFYRILVQ
jgi:hypothetical protein